MFSNHLRKRLYFAGEKFRKDNTLKCLNKLRETQWLSEEEIKKFQWMRIEKLLKYSYLNVPYYKNLFDNLGIKVINGVSINDFRKIPLLDKEIITKNIENLKSARYKPSEFLRDYTSGSTGERLMFYRNKKAGKRNDYYRIASAMRYREWIGTDTWGKQVVLWGCQRDIPQSKKLKDRIINTLFPTLILSSYEMTRENLESYAKKIKRFKPKVLIGYATALYLFADFLDKNQIEIPSISTVISSAETLYPHYREKIEYVFNCRVFNQYSSREFGPISHECEEHRLLHINAEHVYLEIINEDRKICKPGEKGEIIVTDLDNYAFPFIRYRIGDISSMLDERCTCGRGLPLLNHVEGRVFDVIVGTNGNRIVGGLWLVNGIDGIKQFQVIQENFEEMIIKLKVDEKFTEVEKQKLLERVYDRCGKDMKVEFRLVNKIPLIESGKKRFIISKVSPYL